MMSTSPLQAKEEFNDYRYPYPLCWYFCIFEPGQARTSFFNERPVRGFYELACHGPRRPRYSTGAVAGGARRPAHVMIVDENNDAKSMLARLLKASGRQ
jgi:hypothetical protein